MKRILKTVARWRTWLFNTLAGAVILVPEIVQALAGFGYWGDIIPKKYMPLFTLFVLVVNVIMRPRPAVLPSDIEAQK